MKDVQDRIAALEQRGWSLAAIARAVDIHYNTVQKWKAGDRNPSNTKLVIQGLDGLLTQKRVPKKRHARPASADTQEGVECQYD